MTEDEEIGLIEGILEQVAKRPNPSNRPPAWEIRLRQDDVARRLEELRRENEEEVLAGRSKRRGSRGRILNRLLEEQEAKGDIVMLDWVEKTIEHWYRSEEDFWADKGKARNRRLIPNDEAQHLAALARRLRYLRRKKTLSST